MRPKIWNLALQSDRFNAFDLLVDRTIHKLRNNVAQFDLLIDHLILVDSKHCQNHDNYFVFEDILCEILLYWSRDTWIPNNIDPPLSSLNDHTEKLNDEIYAPNNILPFWGMSLYAMPVCYLYSDSGYAYMTFRELYVRYFSKIIFISYFYKLHTVSNQSGSIFHLCILFENLLKQSDSQLYFHLSFNLGINPLDICFKWILYAFVGILEIDQVLLLWDRIVGFDNAALLSITAAALMTFRRDQLMAANDITQVKVSY